MCVFVSRPVKIDTFLDLPKIGCSFSSGKPHPENKIIEIVKDFRGKKLQQQRQTLEIVENFACEDKTSEIFREFKIFLHFQFFSSFL